VKVACKRIYRSPDEVHARVFRFVASFKGLRRIRLAGAVFSQLNTHGKCVKSWSDYLHDAEDNLRKVSPIVNA